MDNQWVPVMYALITALSTGFAAWVSARYAVRAVDTKVDRVIAQNVVQETNIEKVGAAVNGRMAQFRDSLTRESENMAIIAELRGHKTGSDDERQKDNGRTEAILAKAEGAAERVLAIAQTAAKEILLVARREAVSNGTKTSKKRTH